MTTRYPALRPDLAQLADEMHRKNIRDRWFVGVTVTVLVLLMMSPLWWTIGERHTTLGKVSRSERAVETVADGLNKGGVPRRAGEPLGWGELTFTPDTGTVTSGTAGVVHVVVPQPVTLMMWKDGAWHLSGPSWNAPPLTVTDVSVGDVCVQVELPEGAGRDAELSGLSYVHQTVGVDAEPRSGLCPIARPRP